MISFRLLRVAVSGGIDTGTGFFLAVYGPDGHVVDLTPARQPQHRCGGPRPVAVCPDLLPHSEVTAAVTGTMTVHGLRTQRVLEEACIT